MSKFKELCTAFKTAQGEFKNFQDDTYNFSVELVEEFKSYFEVPESQFSLFKFNKKNEFNLVQPAIINALALRPDSLWQFGVGLTVCNAPETLPQELILIHIMIRRDLDGNFFLSHGNQAEPNEIPVEKKGKYNFVPFFDALYETIINTHSQQMTHFIGQDTRRTIGY